MIGWPAMPSLIQFYLVIVAATIVANAVSFTIAVLWPGQAALRLAAAAKASRAAIDRIVQETQEVLVPVAGVPPTAGRGGLRAPPTVDSTRGRGRAASRR